MEYYGHKKKVLTHATTKYYAKWKSSDTKGHLSYESIYVNNPN